MKNKEKYKSVDRDIVLGVMNLFNNEEYYKYAVSVLWTLRTIVLNRTEREGSGGIYWDKNHPDFWIAEITNEIIGRVLINGYNHAFIKGNWGASDSRSARFESLTYDKAEFIAGIVNREYLMDKLHRLRDHVSCYASDVNNPSYNIYKVANDLLGALTGNKTPSPRTLNKTTLVIPEVVYS